MATIYPIERILVMCSPIKLNIPPAKFVRQASILVKYWPRSRRRRNKIRELGTAYYDVSPLYAIAGIFEVGEMLRRRNNLLKTPVMYVSAKYDAKSLLDQADIFKEYFSKTPTEFRIAENSKHEILEGPDKPLIDQWILEWFNSE